MDESRVFGETDRLAGKQMQGVTTLNFTAENDQKLRSEEQSPFDDQGPSIDLGLG